jgi:hypothetical protein
MSELFNGPVVIGMSVRQKGGALLGKGVYGCTFKPAPRCAGGSVFETVAGMPAVGKVTEEDMSAEIGIGKELMRLPLARNYFAVPVVGCRPAMPIDDKDAGKCDVLREAGPFGSFSMAVMPDGGKELRYWALRLDRLADHFESIFVHLLEGMLLYHKAGIVHNDIHMGNIVMDERGTARYIDFGLAFRPASVRRWEDTEMGKTFKPKYVWQAPEIHAARLFMNRIRLTDGSRKLREISEEYGDLERNFPSRKSLETAIADFLRKTDMSDAGLGTYLRENGMCLDWWRLGLCMWMLWMDLCKGLSGFRSSRLYRERRETLLQVIGGMTEFDPYERMSAADALRRLRPTSRII